jgi:hypothetical protein
MNKLETLAKIEGMDVMGMLEEATFDSVAPGICSVKDCDYTTSVEPDSRDGWCEMCGRNTVVSCLVWAGII